MVAFLSLALLAAAPAQQSAASTATPTASRPRTAGAERSADARDKMICKRFAQTGSLVGSYRTCKTKAEWDAEHDDIRAAGTAGTACRQEGGGC